MVNLKRYGFERRPEKDFSDDGSRFLAYEFEGVIITKCTYAGEYYISVDIDFGRDTQVTYDDYCDKEWYRLGDEFNGVKEEEVDVEKLIENIRAIKKGMQELIEEVSKQELDYTEVEETLKNEIKELATFIEENKKVDILKIRSEFTIRRLFDYLSSLQRQLKSMQEKLEAKRFTRYDYQHLQKANYVSFKGVDKDFYAKEIVEMVNQ